MSDDLRERIHAAVCHSIYNRYKRGEWVSGVRADDVVDEVMKVVLAVLRDTPTVCGTCGSDDPTYYKPKCMTEFGHVPDAFHSQGEPCDLCGGTGWVEWDAAEGTPYEGHYPQSASCPRGCKPEGEKK